MGQAEEVDLLKRARQGDESARETLYLTYFSGNKQVRSLLAREIRNPADREDILHDAWLSLVRSPGGIPRRLPAPDLHLSGGPNRHPAEAS